jgi:AcrR family transcriptional regulator
MTPYRYFKDKEAILAAVRARAFDRHAETLERAHAQASLGARAGAIAEAYIRFALENPEAYKLMFDIAQPNEMDYPELVRAGERSRRTMTLHLKTEIAEGRLSGDPDFIGYIYWAALHGALMLHFSRKLPGDIEVRTLILALLTTVDRGVFGAGRMSGATADDLSLAS